MIPTLIFCHGLAAAVSLASNGDKIRVKLAINDDKLR